MIDRYMNLAQKVAEKLEENPLFKTDINGDPEDCFKCECETCNDRDWYGCSPCERCFDQHGNLSPLQGYCDVRGY